MHPVPFAAQIEIGVIGEIDRRLFIRNGGIVDAEHAVRKRIDDRHVEIAGIVFFAVGGKVGKDESFPVDLRLPELCVESLLAAVQMIGTVVDIQRIRLAVDLKTPFIDTIAESADQSAQIAAVFQIPVDVVIAQQNIRRLAVFIGNDEALNNASPG